MYSSLTGLSYQTEKELTDPAHIAGLVQFRDHMPLVMPVAFAMGGIASSVAAIIAAKVLWKIVPAAGISSVIACLAMSGAFFWFVFSFIRRRKLDPLRGYLKDPEAYAFSRDAELFEANYQTARYRNSSRLLVSGRFKGPGDKTFLFFEVVAVDAWPYNNTYDDAHPKPGNEMYGNQKRKRLPVPAVVIYKKSNLSQCALVGLRP